MYVSVLKQSNTCHIDLLTYLNLFLSPVFESSRRVNRRRRQVEAAQKRKL